MKRKHLFVLVFFQISLTLTAQNGHRLTGTVAEESTGRPIQFATVVAIRKASGPDSLAGGAVTAADGTFSLKDLPNVRLKIRVSALGFEAFEKEADPQTTDLGVLRLRESKNLLKEVTIAAAKTEGTLTTEKRTFNVAQNITSAGGTAESLLRNVPSIVIDADGTAKLRNSTATIYINGKPTPLTLAQIPADQIETVEVITNPSAKYEASATGGIVNLVLRKNREAGYNGVASVGIGNNSRYDASVNLDLNQGKWNLTAGYNFNSTQNPLDNYVYRTSYGPAGIVRNYYNQNTRVVLDNHFHDARLIAEYALNRRNTLSASGYLSAGAYNSNTFQHFGTLDASREVVDQGQRTTTPYNDYTNFGFGLGWKRTFAQKGRALSVNFDFDRNTLSNAADWYTNAALANGDPKPGYPEYDRISGRTTGNQYIFQVDYTLPVNDSTKWEMGLRSYTNIRHPGYFFTTLNDSTGRYDLQKNYSQDADISETINAAYVLYTRKLRHRYQIQAGLRLEQSSLHGVSKLDDGATFGYNYPTVAGKNALEAFFPSFSLSHVFSETAEGSFGLSRKVGRPNFRQLFVGIKANDPNNLTIGNPQLQPEFVNTAELNFDKKWAHLHWLSSLYYILEDHTIKPLIKPSPADSSIFITSFINANLDLRGGFDNSLIFSIGKHFTVLAGFNFFNTVLQSDTYRKELWCYNAKLNLTYHFPYNITAQFNLNDDSRFPQLQGYRQPVRAADAAIRKTFLNNRGSIAFTVNDLFDSRKFIVVYDQPDALQHTLSRREVRFYKITLTLPIGRANASLSKKKETKLVRPDVDFGN
jgi:outer membrane receptor protein involved in Fe transport